MSAAAEDFEPLPDSYRVMQQIANCYDDVNGSAPKVALRNQLRRKRGDGLNDAIRGVDRV